MSQDFQSALRKHFWRWWWVLMVISIIGLFGGGSVFAMSMNCYLACWMMEVNRREKAEARLEALTAGRKATYDAVVAECARLKEENAHLLELVAGPPPTRIT